MTTVYQIRFLDRAIKDLASLDRTVANRVVKRLDWLTINAENINPEALTGPLAGFYKFRVGDYRVVYEIIHDEELLLIHFVGYRRNVYRP